MQRIHLIATGGTIEKIYSEQRGSVENLESKIESYLKRLRLPDAEVDTTRLMNKDSLEMTEADRAQVLATVKSKLDAPIVITHGTDTMVETADVLGREIRDKTVVLTGAMVPYAFGSSDGLFNLGSALSFAQTLPPGVYIAMNGRCFTWDNVVKNRSAGIFEPLR